MLSETIAELERLYNTANDSDFAKEFQVMAGQKLADLFWFNAPALLAAAKLSEARAKVCELAKALEAKSIESYNAKKKPSGEWDEYDEMALPLWENLTDALAALAAAEKGSA